MAGKTYGLARTLTRSIACVIAIAVSRPLATAPVDTHSGDMGRRLQSSAPEVLLGDRLFFETRFAQYFFANFDGDVNAPLAAGDPVVDDVPRPRDSVLPGPFRGQSMSCRHCHLGDDFIRTEPLAQRTYCDFTARSAIPHRNDGPTQTVRNTPIMVDFGLPREAPRLLHFDGEFANAEDLIIDTLVGRNMGWLFEEHGPAIAHIARVIREDQGVNPRHVRTLDGQGLPYRIVMRGTDPTLLPHLQIPPEYRLDVQTASDPEILRAIAQLIHAYMDSIRFGTDDTNRPTGSPYDLFLVKNQLPAKPAEGESNVAYARRLLGFIEQRKQFTWIRGTEDGYFDLHSQPYVFGTTELAGLKIFFSESNRRQHNSRVGNCIACHTPPQFTDHRLHNTGVSQDEYDALFGDGAFAALEIPSLAARNLAHEAYLPASAYHPKALNRFRSAPSKDKPGFADLGVWNIYANPDFPKPQAALSRILCAPIGTNAKRCAPELVLPLSIGLFKTPSVRDPGHSQPYFHSGRANTIEDVLEFYSKASMLARAGRLRNASPEMLGIHINAADIPALAAFLRSLNEDYH